MLLFAISALRAVLEMIGLCLIGQGALYLLAGQGRESNAIYRLFQLITGPLVRLVALPLPRSAPAPIVGLLTFAVLFSGWIGLAILRKSI